MRVANCAMGSSVFAIHAISFFAPERRSQTARGLREEADGRTRRRRSVTEAGTPCRNHRLMKPERKNHTSEPNGDSRGSTSNVKRSSSRPSAKRQVISSGLTTSITIARLPVRRSTTISPRCGMDHLHRLLEEGMRREGTVTVLRAGVIDDGIVTLRRLVVAGGGTDGDGRLSYAALSGARALGFVSSNLPPTSRSDTDEHGSPSKTNPATTGTDLDLTGKGG